MTLTAKDVAEITRLLEDSSFDEMELELEGLRLSFKRGGRASGQSGASDAASDTAGGSAAPSNAAPSSAGASDGSSDPSLREIVAPLLGTFYRAPKPGAAPFVQVGSQIEEDSVVGIIEVMKLMTSVRAGVRGEVREIMAEDGVLVEYGQALLRVRVVAG